MKFKSFLQLCLQAWDTEISGNTPDDVLGKLTLDGQAFSAESHSDVSVNEAEAPVSDSSDGGCNASVLGLVAMAVILIRKKVIRHA